MLLRILLSILIIANLTKMVHGQTIDLNEIEEALSTSEGEENEETNLPVAEPDTNSSLAPDAPKTNNSPVPSNSPASSTTERQDSPKMVNYNTSKVIAINKITAKAQVLTLELKKPQYFGNIEITVHKCLKSADLYSPESKILLTVTESKIDEDPLVVFQGWLISSNIPVSTFEHPVYEIFAKDCF